MNIKKRKTQPIKKNSKTNSHKKSQKSSKQTKKMWLSLLKIAAVILFWSAIIIFMFFSVFN